MERFHFELWQCQQCGALIGYLGRFLRGLLGRRLYGRMVGCCYDLRQPLDTDSENRQHAARDRTSC